MLTFTNSRRCRRKQRDHRDETEGEQGERGKNLRERQASLPGQERSHWHRYGPIVTRPEPATVTVKVRLLTASVTV